MQCLRPDSAASGEPGWRQTDLEALALAERDTPENSVNILLARLRNAVQRSDILAQLADKVMKQTITVLTGGDGCGKTTAALLLMHHVKNCLKLSTFWAGRASLQTALAKNVRLVVMNDFLGHTTLDSYDKWRYVVKLLNACVVKKKKGLSILLVTRRSVLDDGRHSFAADLSLIMCQSNIITLAIDHEKMFESLVKVPMKKPSTQRSPVIGFPLCCHLVPHLERGMRERLFEYPRAALKITLLHRVHNNRLAKLALGLLAVVGGHFDTRRLGEDKKYIDILKNLDKSPSFKKRASREQKTEEYVQSLRRETIPQIVSYYERNQGLVIFGPDWHVSFVNEAVEDATLLALLENHAEFVGKYITLKTISHLAEVTSDESDDNKHKYQKPQLIEPARKVFLGIVLQNLKNRAYREVFTSPILQHKTFAAEFTRGVMTSYNPKDFMNRRDRDGIGLIFWAGACKELFSPLASCYRAMNSDCEYQSLLACCFWGRINELELYFLRNIIKQLAIRKISTFFSKDLPEPAWSKAPFDKHDTLLTTAAKRGHGNVVKYLLKLGCDVNSRGESGCTALMHFCTRGDSRMVESIMKLKVNVELANDQGMRAIHFAFNREPWPVPIQLLQKCDHMAITNLQETPLIIARRNGWKDDDLRDLLDLMNTQSSFRHFFFGSFFRCW